MFRRALTAFLVLTLGVFAGCGKNEPIMPIGSVPYQAPPPAYYPQNPYPQGPGYQQPPYFQPQIPQNQPPAYYPFVPVDNYFRQNPQTQPFWGPMWNRWQSYSGQRGTNPYDFNKFWYDFCPQDWGQRGYGDLYRQFDDSFYWWATPQTQWDVNVDVNVFWAPYDGYSYGEFDDGCWDGCY